ncbi:hypothetical protein SESBI_29974 [Sesbania bispinosa]|nr:hypothetical protein SESBI_29974 [Sesbania bispinosa]
MALRQLKRTQVEIRASWRNIRRKCDDELGKPRIAAYPDYKEWRREREVQGHLFKKDHCNKEASEETIKTLELMNSQLEIMKAQMILLEENKDRGDLDGCERKVKSRRDMFPRITPSELKKKLEEQEGLVVEILQEKKELEARNQIQDIRMERLQGNVTEANRHADKGWEIAKKYHDLLVQAREKEEKLKSKIEELENPEICQEGMVDQQGKD